MRKKRSMRTKMEYEDKPAMKRRRRRPRGRWKRRDRRGARGGRRGDRRGRGDDGRRED